MSKASEGFSSKRSVEVDQYIEKLEHPRKEEVEALRAIILDSGEQITEHIKWNAPSFCYRGEDRVTFRLQPGDRIQLIFHRGAKAKDSQGFEFTDDTGLLEWVTGDRAVVTFHDIKDVDAKTPALRKVIHHWLEATR